jgi:acyl carrier protein
MEFEDAFEITIPDEDAEQIQTIGTAVEYISKKLPA